MPEHIWLVFERNRALINIQLLSKFGEDQIVNGASNVFTISTIAILIISRAIIQSCMGGFDWFAKGTKLSWISNYCISLNEIQSKLKTVSRSQAIVYRHTHGRRTPHHGINSLAFCQ